MYRRNDSRINSDLLIPRRSAQRPTSVTSSAANLKLSIVIPLD